MRSSGAIGSSPHTRGAQRRIPLPRGLRRIIPAYAGSTGWGLRIPHIGRDHPRIRGEHWGHGGPGRGPRGSSPHTRGAHVGDQSPQLLLGIIPAYAGST